MRLALRGALCIVFTRTLHVRILGLSSILFLLAK